MKKKVFLAGMLVLALAFGMMIVGCDNGTTNDGDGSTGGGKVDAALNGTWLDEDGYVAIRFNNGSYEGVGYSMMSTAGGGEEVIEVIDPAMKGTYSTSNGKLTIKTTHVHGNMLDLDSKWYSKSDLEKALKDAGESTEYLDMYFMERTGTYSISGNKLTTTFDGESSVLTKK